MAGDGQHPPPFAIMADKKDSTESKNVIIGISGYARAGKDEIAKILVEEFDFKRIAFADKLREMLYQLNPWVYDTESGDLEVNIVGPGQEIPVTMVSTVQKVIDQYGWDGYKETEFGNSIRALLQRLGTEAGRNTLWDSIWVDAALKDYKPGDRLVVPDTRFLNECDAIKSRGGKLWRVNRKGIGPANNHVSETGIDGYRFDVVFNNNWSLEDLRNSVRSTMHDNRKAPNEGNE